MEDWKSTFSVRNEGYFTCKTGNFKHINRADRDRLSGKKRMK